MFAFRPAAAIVLAAAGFVDRPAADLPPANAAVVEFCEKHAGAKVGDGECAALADQALNSAGAKTARDFAPSDSGGDPVWGTPVERPEDVLPGDVVQFRDVKILVRGPGGTKAIRSSAQHTAIVAKNRGQRVLDLYEQNVLSAGTGAADRFKLRKRRTDFRGMTEGTVRIYRPVAKDAADGRE